MKQEYVNLVENINSVMLPSDFSSDINKYSTSKGNPLFVPSSVFSHKENDKRKNIGVFFLDAHVDGKQLILFIDHEISSWFVLKNPKTGKMGSNSFVSDLERSGYENIPEDLYVARSELSMDGELATPDQYKALLKDAIDSIIQLGFEVPGQSPESIPTKNPLGGTGVSDHS